jgi:hypothetical protein
VKTEAAEGAARGILVPALIDKVQIPLEFKRIEAADLSEWHGDSAHFEFDQLLKTVAGILGGNAITQTTQNITNTKLRSRRWWKTMPGLFATAGCMIAAVVGLIVVLNQFEFYDGKANHLSRTQDQTESKPFKAEAVAVPSKPAIPDSENQAPSVAKLTPSAPSSTSAINLLSSENGGHIIIATNDHWRYAIDGDENNWQYIDSGVFGGWAVYGFKNERAAIFDRFKVLILGAENWNLRGFELLAGKNSATGTFESIGKFETQNVRFFKDPYQEFRFPAVKAKYLKIKVLSSHGFSSVGVFEFQLLGVLEK